MSNARNLANLLGTGSTIATAKIADDAITAAKIDDDGTGFTFGDISVAGAVVGDSFTQFDKLKLDGSSVATVTVNSAVSSSATVVVDGVSGTIAVGMVVNVSDTTVRSISDASSETAVSVDDTLTITAVASQTSFTVSEAVSIADNVVLILRADENSKMVLDASAASTDVGEEILFEDATGDGSTVLNSGEGHAISGSSVKGQVLQIQSVIDNVDRTFSGNQQIVYASLPASTAGFTSMTKTVTPISSRSKFYIFVKSHQNENTNTNNGDVTTLFADTNFIAYSGGALFVYSGGTMSTPQTNPINIQAVYFGKHQAGVAIEFHVQAGSSGTNTGAVRLNNGGGLPTGVTGFAVSSSMIIMEVL